jgi:tellurite resistance protein TerC
VVVIWIAFLSFILVLLALDLGVFHRRAHVVSVREALTWTLVWITTALAFACVIYLGYDRSWLGMGLVPDAVDRSAAWPEGRVNDARSAVLKFLTGYLVELSLSADNVFVIAMLFNYFAIPRMYQHRVLFWGILGALGMRGAMIAVGAQLVSRFSWTLSVFGLVLIATAARMLFMGDKPADPGQKLLVRLMRRLLPLTTTFHGEHFVVRRDSRDASTRWLLTPLVPALVMVETTDLIFAVDSIPAIFAITADPFLVFTSNVFAILGLRSLYFARWSAACAPLHEACARRRAADGRREDARALMARADARPAIQSLHAGRGDDDSWFGRPRLAHRAPLARAGSSGYPISDSQTGLVGRARSAPDDDYRGGSARDVAEDCGGRATSAGERARLVDRPPLAPVHPRQR